MEVEVTNEKTLLMLWKLLRSISNCDKAMVFLLSCLLGKFEPEWRLRAQPQMDRR